VWSAAGKAILLGMMKSGWYLYGDFAVWEVNSPADRHWQPPRPRQRFPWRSGSPSRWRFKVLITDSTVHVLLLWARCRRFGINCNLDGSLWFAWLQFVNAIRGARFRIRLGYILWFDIFFYYYYFIIFSSKWRGYAN